MSHVTTVKTKIKDVDALKSACNKTGTPIEVSQAKRSWKMYGNQWSEGHVAFTPETFTYPVVVDTEVGNVQYDTYPHGNLEELHKVQQRYAAEVVLKQVQNLGYIGPTEEVDAEENICITCQVV